eukprot:7515431-Pyramimonas_sp.AAC.1
MKRSAPIGGVQDIWANVRASKANVSRACAKRIVLHAHVRQCARSYHPQHAMLVSCEVVVGIYAPTSIPVVYVCMLHTMVALPRLSS